MTSNEITLILGAVSASIIAPVVSYLKTADNRRETAQKRDNDHALLEQRVSIAEKRLCEIDEIKAMITDIRIVMGEIKMVMEFFKKHMDEEK